MRPRFSHYPLTRPSSSVAIIVAATAVFALPAGVWAQAPSPAAPTFSKEAAPIL